jgi:hypothetical protein
MRKRRYTLVPNVEGLEVKALLSGAIVGSSMAGAVSPPMIKVIHLNGTFRGDYHRNDSNPDKGSIFDLNGSGDVSGLSHAFVSGRLHSIGNVAQGHASGTLYLALDNGTITLHLYGPEQDNGPKGLPDVFKYKVTGGTGKYSNVFDKGTATLVTIPGHSTAHPGDPDYGAFTLVLTSTSTTS